METILTIVHIVVAVFMIGVVLLQAGKGSGMGALGGGASQAAFGASSGMTFMGKLTAGAAAVFMLTSMSLAYMSSNTTSIVDDVMEQAQEIEKVENSIAPVETEEKAEAKPEAKVEEKPAVEAKKEAKPEEKKAE